MLNTKNIMKGISVMTILWIVIFLPSLYLLLKFIIPHLLNVLGYREFANSPYIYIIICILLLIGGISLVGRKKDLIARNLSRLAFIIFFSLFLLPIIFGDILGVDITSLGLPFFIAVTIAAVLLGISGFLPYESGKILREMSYIGLFVALLIFFLSALKPFIRERTELTLENCTSVFFPKPTDQTAEEQQNQIIYGLLTYVSCILTGKFPLEQGDLGWSVFIIFYLVLPFAFILAFVYGLMQGVNVATIFGGNQTAKNIVQVLSLIIALYAMRTTMGVFILEFMGYGAWGLGAVFISILIVLGLKKMVDDWLDIEKKVEETRKMIQAWITRERQFAESILPRINETLRLIEHLQRDQRRGGSPEQLQEQEQLQIVHVRKLLRSYVEGNHFYSLLNDERKKAISLYLERADRAQRLVDLRQVVEEFKGFLELMRTTKI